MSDKRYQVFVSSTFNDLKDERREIAQTLMTMGCIPAGMEFFTAMDEDTFEFIKTVIDLSDYYLLIIANRYGSLAPDGLSYTEKEYDYAISKGLKVVALVHEKPETISVEKSEEAPGARRKLEAFREKVQGGGKRIVKHWTKPEELPGYVSLSVQAAIARYPAVGWVRGNQAASTQILTELNEAQKRIQELEARLVKAESRPMMEDLAGLDESFDLQCVASVRGQNYALNVPVTWRYLFAALGPFLMEFKGDLAVRKLLNELAFYLSPNKIPDITVITQSFHTIKLQLKALGLVDIASGGNGSSWRLTPGGERLLLELRTDKAGPDGRGWRPEDVPPIFCPPGPTE